jgi:hypothetical protein
MVTVLQQDRSENSLAALPCSSSRRTDYELLSQEMVNKSCNLGEHSGYAAA